MAASDIAAAGERHRAELAAGEAKAASRMVRAYGQAWTATKAQLDRVLDQIGTARAAGVDVRGGWLYQERRLSRILDTLHSGLRRFSAVASGEVIDAQATAVEAAQGHVVRAVRAQDPGLVTSFDRLPSGALDALVGNMADGSPLPALFASFPAQAGSALERALVSGVARGLGPMALLGESRAALADNLTQALTVLRTESLRSARESARAGMAANPDVVAGWVWTCACTARSCGACWAMHGRVFPTSERMGTHPNCFPAGTAVSGPRPTAATKRWYDGDLVDIRTDAGVFSVTPNHPVLTTKGWVAAGRLGQGHHIVRRLWGDGAVGPGPNDQHGEALIEEVAETLGGPLGVSAPGVPAAPEDFHGDGAGSQVYVVRADRRLLLDVESPGPEQLGEHGLCFRHALEAGLPGQGTLALLVLGDDAASNGSVGRGGPALALLGSGPGGHSPSGGRAAAAVDSRLLEPGGDYPAGNSEALSEAVLALSGPIAGHEVLHGQVVAALFGGDGQASGLGGPLFDPRTPQSPADQLPAEASLADMVDGGGLLAALAAEVHLDRVLDVDRRRWSGHVFNLQTTEGWYTANGIVVHNCRCTMVPATHTWAEMGFGGAPDPALSIEPGVARFARQSEAVQRAVLGRSKLGAYRSGEISLDDLVGRRDDPRWGTTRYERSLRAIRRARAQGAPDVDFTFRLGRPLDAGEARSRAVLAAARRAERRLEVEAEREAARSAGVSLGEFRSAKADLVRVRRSVRAEAAAVADAAFADLDAVDARKLARPPRRRTTTDVLGRTVWTRGPAGEWDWLEGLDEAEVRRLRRSWMAEDLSGYAPDQMAARWARHFGPDEDAIEGWLTRTRLAEAGSTLRRGRLPAPDAYGRLSLDELAPSARSAGYSIERLFGDVNDAAAHVIEVTRHQAQRWAAGAFRPAVHGPAPYRMATEDYVAELTALEARWANVRPVSVDPEFGPLYSTADRVVGERLGELIPDGIEDAANPLRAEQLHRLITDLAGRAGLL